MSTLIVTRHSGLVQYLIAKGFVSADVEVVEHASAEVVTGKHVWGVLPHSLSVLCASFTEIPLSLPVELRGKELTMEQVEEYAGEPVTYIVKSLHAAEMDACRKFFQGHEYGKAGLPLAHWNWEAVVLDPTGDIFAHEYPEFEEEEYYSYDGSMEKE